MASSSRQHKYLKFNKVAWSLEQRNDIQEKFDTIRDHKIFTPDFLDMEVLEDIREGNSGCKELEHEELSCPIRQEGLPGDIYISHAWENLMVINEPIYREITLEFVSSFQFFKTGCTYNLRMLFSFNYVVKYLR